MNKLNIKKASLSILLVFSFLATVFFIPNSSIVASAASIPTDFGENLIKDLTMTARYSLDGSTFTSAPDNTKFKNINDGDTSTEFFIGTPKFAENIGGNTVYYKDGSKVFLDLQFDIGVISDIKAVYMLNHNDSRYRTNRFKIYLSKKPETLFSESDSLVKDFTNTNADAENVIILDEVRKARYVGIRILNPVSQNVSAAEAYTRILEFSVLGQRGEVPSLKGSNVLKNLPMKTFYSNNGTDRKTLSDNGIYSRINDGDTTTEFFTGTPKFAEKIGGSNVYYKDGTKVYLDLIFDLEASCKIYGLKMFNHTSQDLRTGRFKIYLSDNENELFNDSKSLVDDVTNTNKLKEFEFIFDEPIKARYFAIRILNPVSAELSNPSEVYTRINELMLYAEEPEINVKVVSSDFTASKNKVSELKSDSNLLYNKTYFDVKQFSDGEDTSEAAGRWLVGNPKGITNAVVNDAAFLPGTVYYEENGTCKNTAPYNRPKAYTTVSYYLGGKAKLDSVWIYNHSNKDLANYVYEVYVSDSNITLFDEESLIKQFVNTSSATKQEFNFKTPVEGRYLGVKFIVPVPPASAVSTANKYVRLSQIAAFGTVETADFENYYHELSVQYDYNVLKGIKPDVSVTDKDNSSDLVVDTKALTDENFENQVEFSKFKFADYNNGSPIIYENGERFLDLSFDFNTIVNVDAIALVNHPNTKRVTNKYKLYLSNEKDNLFDDANLMEDFQNVAGDRLNVFEVNSSDSKRYFGIRIIDPAFGELTVDESINDVYARISDIAVFGSYADPNYKVNIVKGIINLTEKEFKSFGESLISGYKTPKWFYNDANIPAPWAYVEQSALLTDGKLDKHADITSSKFKLSTSDGSNKLDVAYVFDEFYDFSGFTFLGISTPGSESYYTGWYQVYVAEDPDAIFLPENMLFEYNWEKDGAVRGHNVTFDNYKARGKVFGIRILNPVTYATTFPVPRLSEIAVYGEKAIIEIKPTNLAANMPVEAYTESKSGELATISEKNLSFDELKMLTDMDTDTVAKIKTSKKTVHLSYNLCNDVKLTSLKLVSNAKKYKIYATNDINKIWDNDSLIYSYKGKGKNGKTLSGSNAKKKYRYIRFEISEFGDELKIAEVSVIGGDDQLLKYKTVSRTLGHNNVSMALYNYKTKNYRFINSDAYFYKFFDNDILTSVGIEGGKDNEETIDLIITFDDIKNIDSISLYFPDMLEGYNPTELELYTSEKLAEFDSGDFELEPLESFKGLPEEGVYTINFRPKFARVMLIRFIAGNQKYNGYDHMCFAVNEVSVKGTSVVGIQPDEDDPALLTFEDKNSGVVVDILKYDKNDIMTDVTGIKVTEEKASTEQKVALAESGSLKIVNDKVYKINFVNVFGKPVYDIGGRKYKVSIAYDENKLSYPMMASGDGKNCATLNSDIYDGRVYYETDLFDNDKFLLATFANSNDPYFENLDVEIPDIPMPDFDIEQDIEYQDGEISPETGESFPLSAVVFAALFIISCMAFIISARKHESN